MMIRKAEAADLSAIQTFYAEVVPTIEFEITSWIPGVYPSIDTAEKAIEEQTMHLAVLDGRVVGSVILNHDVDEEYAEIAWQNPQLPAEQIVIVHTLMTSPNYRNRGIARQLLNYAEHLAKEQNCQAIRLDTFAANHPAQQLYKKLGYRYCGAGDLPSWQGEGTDACVFFELVLAD
ncbi:GNAT family N-acetyltransferase [Candidatus Enterococcus ferrettii]|uniref:N-acetyltransferase domain-containing protein n=1 Tax=Candidatus Enterococcus ferrettii TaxID=2815324 RepID=A0ABV0EUI3_9ENTE|nr:GNAT family N-acetyltransferase [Enterococcus sp. 665A]MBO1339401.1 GNAT family N-acetyltransferase [Enterococcus sp. 665A]